MKTAVSAVACWLPLFVSLQANQQLPSEPPPIFRTGVDAVQLDVSVLDKEPAVLVVATGVRATRRPPRGVISPLPTRSLRSRVRIRSPERNRLS